MFCRTQWPSPEEYSQLEVQTSLGRTDIVRWFKDHRSALKNGEALGWMSAFQNPTLRQKAEQEQNGRGSEDVCVEAKPAHGELAVDGGRGSVRCNVSHSSPVGAADQPAEKAAQAKLSEQDKVQWLTDRIAHGVTDLIRTRPDQTSPSAEKGRWVKKKNNLVSS